METGTASAKKGDPNGLASDAPSPVWPELDSSQKADALSWSRAARLRFALLGAAALAAVTALAAYRTASPGAADWRVGASIALAACFVGVYFVVRSRQLPAAWLTPVGLVTIALTQVNLMACMMEQVAGDAARTTSTDPGLVFLTLIVGTLWALSIHLSPVTFSLSALISGVVLWAPWVALTEAPIEFSLTGLACLAAGAQMRWISTERAYARYRREIVWPRLWRGSLQAAVLRELSRRAILTDQLQPSEPMVALASAVEGARTQSSLLSLAAALGGSEAPSPEASAPQDVTRKSDSQE